MLEHSSAYIHKCKELGILTDSPVRQYPLKPANLAAVLKMYALQAKVPYKILLKQFSVLADERLYLTELGEAWLFDQWQQYSLEYLRSILPYLFATIPTLKDLNKVDKFRNFIGLSGEGMSKYKPQRAVLIRTRGIRKEEMHYGSVKEAREALLTLTRFYPLSQYKLYAINNRTGQRVETPLILRGNPNGVNKGRLFGGPTNDTD